MLSDVSDVLAFTISSLQTCAERGCHKEPNGIEPFEKYYVDEIMLV